jgi:dethiobiotin synthetase
VTNSSQRSRSRVVFVTGTDTGVGKTLVTGLLLRHLRSRGVRTLAIKPFCSGGLGDTRLLRDLQDRELTQKEISPFCYRKPLAPLVAGRMRRHKNRLSDVVVVVQQMRSKCDCLLVEGIGGLLVPLGEGFCVRDLIASIDCDVLVVASNRLGTINHTLLTVNALRDAGIQRINIVLSGVEKKDASSQSNASVLTELAAPHPVMSIPFLGRDAVTGNQIRKNCEKLKKTLARVLDFDTFSLPFGKSVKAVSENSR